MMALPRVGNDWRGAAPAEWRRTTDWWLWGLALAALGATLWLTRASAPAAVTPKALLAPPHGHPSVGQADFAVGLTYLLPQLALPWMLVCLEDLRPRGRAIWATYPVPSWTRSAIWLVGLLVLVAVPAALLPLAWPANPPVAPTAAAALVLPVALLLGGSLFLFAELLHSLEGAAAGTVLISVASFMAMHVMRAAHPLWWMLFAAGAYPASAALAANRVDLGVLGLAAWGLATGVHAYQAKRGWDT